MLSERLREETKEAHQALERMLIPMIREIRSVADYVRLLGLMYGYHNPVERQLAIYLNDAIVPLYTQRRNSNALVKDMLAFTEEPVLTECATLPAITNEWQALGAMYVLEGSTLGGAVISRMLTRDASLGLECGLRFFDYYGEERITMWQSFKAALDAMPASAEEQDDTIATARDTFERFRQWIEHRTVSISTEVPAL